MKSYVDKITHLGLKANQTITHSEDQSMEQEYFNPPTPRPAEPIMTSFQTSADTDKLDEALAKAQGEIEVALKDAENPHFRSSYADLASVWRACRGPLSKYVISVTQWPIRATRTEVELLTRVAHAGQWICSSMTMPVDKPNAHGVGTALTYLRRYMLSAVAGVAPDEPDLMDDDGNHASGIQNPPQRTSQTNSLPNRTAQKPITKPNPSTPGQDVPKAGIVGAGLSKVPVTQAQIARMFALAKDAKWSGDQIKLYMEMRWGISSTKELSRDRYDAMVDVVQQQTYAQACMGIQREAVK